MKKLFIIFLLSGLFLSCDSQSQPNQAQGNAKQTDTKANQAIIISGKIKYPQQGFIVLNELQEKGFKSLDSVQLKKDKTYALTIKEKNY